MVHVGSERERPCFCGLFKYTTSHQSLEEWLKKGDIVAILLKTPVHATINLNHPWEGVQKAQQGLKGEGYLFCQGKCNIVQY